MIELPTIESKLKALKDKAKYIKGRQLFDYKSFTSKRSFFTSGLNDLAVYLPGKMRAKVYKVTIDHVNKNGDIGRLSYLPSPYPDVLNNIEPVGNFGALPPPGLSITSYSKEKTEYMFWAISAKQAEVDDYIYFKFAYEGSDDFTYSIDWLYDIYDIY